MDWQAWHDDYALPDSALSQRLRSVQQQIGRALDEAPPGRLRVISLCAGQGHDLLGVVQRHPRREDITARLVELDPHNATVAKRTAQATGLRGIDIVVGDAAMTYHYHGMVPANIVLACGVFGNITDQDIEHTLAHCPILRPRRHPDLDSTSQLTRPRAVDLPSARTSRLRAAMAI
ncbi:MAG: class I SAM-dependent methyltransferase [Pseudonocardiaceae bacterium]